MLQESVYCKLLLNATAQKTISEILRRNKPPKGIVQMLTITEKQFAKAEYIVGEFSSNIIASDERLIEV